MHPAQFDLNLKTWSPPTALYKGLQNSPYDYKFQSRRINIIVSSEKSLPRPGMSHQGKERPGLRSKDRCLNRERTPTTPKNRSRESKLPPDQGTGGVSRGTTL